MDLHANPFAVKTPETLQPSEIVELFVPYPEFSYLQSTGHQFLHGHRGSGKSMMLKMMEPECQALNRNISIKNIDYFGAYISVKTTEINQPEFERLENETSGFVLSEHILCTKILSAIINSLKKYVSVAYPEHEFLERISNFAKNDFKLRLELCGWSDDGSLNSFNGETHDEILDILSAIIDKMHAVTIRYVKSRAFTSIPIPYSGALLGFQDAVLPIVLSLRKLKVIPDCPVYILIDDADNLTLQQSRVLNTWVSYRSTDIISLKISTQLSYKTMQTSGGSTIEAPHDFSEIYFTTVRTGSLRDGYTELVSDIVELRLKKYGINNISSRDFFPEDEEQEAAIKSIAEQIKLDWVGNDSGGFRASDDAYRQARPEYIRRLGGKSKQSASYKYAGFEQLVHISSGIIRFFLDTAARMFAEEQKGRKDLVRFISPSIQDIEIRRQSDELLLSKLDQIHEENLSVGSSSANEIRQLRNLIEGIGFLFHAYLVDATSSQRRVFSFTVADQIDDAVGRILSLGVKYGYLYRDSITKKEGRGRSVLYVLSRRLAPAFRLDPIGFSHHLSVTNAYLKELSFNPRSYSSRFKNGVSDGLQLSILDEDIS